MRHIKKADVEAIGTLASNARGAWDDLVAAETAEDKAEAHQSLEAARKALHEKLDGIRCDLDDWISDRSEKWAEGDTADAYNDWLKALEELSEALDDEVDPEEADEPGWLDTVEFDLPVSPDL